MANGNATLLTFAPTPTPACAPPAAAEINAKIEVMVADAVAAAAQGVVDWAEVGVMSPATRTLNGEMLGRIVMLRLDNPLPDFDAVALDEGRKVLARRHGATMCRQQYRATVDTLVDELLHHVVYITKTIFASELALMARN